MDFKFSFESILPKIPFITKKKKKNGAAAVFTTGLRGIKWSIKKRIIRYTVRSKAEEIKRNLWSAIDRKA